MEKQLQDLLESVLKELSDLTKILKGSSKAIQANVNTSKLQLRDKKAYIQVLKDAKAKQDQLGISTTELSKTITEAEDNLEDFSKNNSFHRVLWDHALEDNNKFIKLKAKKEIKKVILCSGKIYFDLLEAREQLKIDDIVMFRIEQLYPFPLKSLVKEMKPYAKKAKFYWCQEEPKNMGAWFSVRDYIQWTLDNIGANNNKISYIGRNPAASPATGYAKRHLDQQKEIVKKVFK